MKTLEKEPKVLEKEHKVFGCIVNLRNKKEYYWENTPIKQVVSDCRELSGLVYNKDWKFGGDQGVKESNIFVSNVPNPKSIFCGKNAVTKFLKIWGRRI